MVKRSKAKTVRRPLPKGNTREELAAKEAFNFALFQHNPLAMTVVDHAGRVIKSNLARRRAPDPLPELGSLLYEGSGEQDGVALRASLVASIASGKVVTLPEQPVGDRWQSLTFSPFSQGAIVIVQDITERKQAEAESRRQEEQLIQADKMASLGTLVSGVAHEVSNPNNAMLLSTSQLRKLCHNLLPVLDAYYAERGDFAVGSRPYSEVREDMPDLIDVIGRAAERIRTMVKELKDFARKEDAAKTVAVDLNAVVASAVSLMGASIRKATDRFETDYAADLPPVEGNAQRIEQVVVNLVNNACQALPAKDRVIRVSTRCNKRKHVVIVDVADEGDGVAPEDLPRITDPFFTTKHDTGGTGLGLSISHRIVTDYGGSLTFTSELQKGTTATIMLPCNDPLTPALSPRGRGKTKG